MFSGRYARVRNWSITAGVLVLVAAGSAAIAASAPAAAYESGTTWTVGGGTATATTPSGLITTVTSSGDVSLSGHQSFATAGNPTSSEYDPDIDMKTDALRFTSGAACFANTTCAATGTNQVGHLTITFSEPVRNPALHFEGIGAATPDTVFASTYTLDSSQSDGATLGAVSPGATDLQAVNGTISTVSARPNTACNTATATTDGTAGCGTVHVKGIVTTLTFNVGIRSTQLTTTGDNSTSGDSVGFAVTFDQNSGDGPASYNQGNQPEHVNGDLALGPSLDPIVGSVGRALSAWPTLTTAMIGTTYAVPVPISGASRAGVVCGYLDFAAAGTFSSSEDSACSAFAAGAASVTLSWTVPADLTAGLTYARLRAAYDPTQAESPTGLASSGEVEDYQVSVLPTLTIKTTLPADTVGTFARSADNTLLPTDASGITSNGTVGPSAAGLARPDVTVSGDIRTAPLALSVSEAATGRTAFDYTAVVTCVDGLGQSLAFGSGLVQSVSIPQSGHANGKAQNVTCTFDTSGVPALALSAAAAPTSATSIGQSLAYTFLVTNTGNAAVTKVAVTDSVTADSGSLAISCQATTLAPNATTTCTAAAYTASQADVDRGQVTNSATATAVAGATTISSSPSSIDTAINATSGLSVKVTGKVNGAATVGDNVRWNAVVTNSGLTTVHDLNLATPAGVSATCAQTTLAPTASTTCTMPVQVVTETQANEGQVTASLLASGRAVTGTVLSSPALSAVAVGAPIPLTGVSEIGPTLGAGAGAVLAGIGLLMVAGPGRRRRRGQRRLA